MDRHITFTSATASIVIACSCTVWWWIREKKQALTKTKSIPPVTGIPLVPDPHWLLGHLPELRGHGLVAGYSRTFAEFADPTGLSSSFLLYKPIVSVLLAKDVKAVLFASCFRKETALITRHNVQFLGPKRLTSMMGKEWKLYRTAVHKSFTPSVLQQSQKSIRLVGETLANSLVAGIQASDEGAMHHPSVVRLLKMATIDVFGRAVLGVDFGCCSTLKTSKVGEAFGFLTQEYTRRLQNPLNPFNFLYWLPSPTNRRFASKRKVIRTFISDLIRNAKESKEDSDQKSDVLATLLRVNADQGEEIADDATVADIMVTLLFGGYDTTSIALSCALYLLATHPEVERECLGEIMSVMGTTKASDDSISGPDALPYTRAVICEALRMYPPAPLTARHLEKPMEIRPGVVLPEGASIFVPIWSIQRCARNFPDPESMRPDRWVRQRGDGKWEDRPQEDTESSDVPPANRDAFCVFSALSLIHI